MTAAKIRVELDTSGASQQLSALYRQASSPIAVPTAGAGVPGGGGGGAGGFGRFAALGGGLAGIFGGLGRGTLGTGASVANAGIGSASHRLEQSIFGDTNARLKGSRDALERLKADAGLAVGMGADPAQFQGLFSAMRNLSVKTAQGQKDLETEFGQGISDRAANDMADRITRKIEELINAVKNWRPWQ